MAQFGEELPGVAAADAAPGALLDLLEARTGALVERYRESQQMLEELRAELADREQRIAELQEHISVLDRNRTEARKRLEGLVREIERVQKAQSRSSSSG
jgi:septal ring factor EnvC (AmiA/AmiB activator)